MSREGGRDARRHSLPPQLAAALALSLAAGLAACDGGPEDDRLLVEVVADTCLNLRERASLDAPTLACLPNGAVAETDDFALYSRTDDFVLYPQPWLHLRTDDGLEGWASAEYLRWHSDGVRLEE